MNHNGHLLGQFSLDFKYWICHCVVYRKSKTSIMQVKNTAVCLSLGSWQHTEWSKLFCCPALCQAVKGRKDPSFSGVIYLSYKAMKVHDKSSCVWRECQDRKWGDALLVIPLMGSSSCTEKSHRTTTVKTLGREGGGEMNWWLTVTSCASFQNSGPWNTNELLDSSRGSLELFFSRSTFQAYWINPSCLKCEWKKQQL